MSLGPDEFRAHLEASAATAGVPLPDLALPSTHHVLLGRTPGPLVAEPLRRLPGGGGTSAQKQRRSGSASA